MMRNIFKIWIIAVFIVFPAAFATAETPLTALVKKVQPAVVKIVVYDMNKMVSSIGSGFFIDNKRHLVTNYHVLAGAFSADAVAYDGGTYPINLVLAEDRAADLIKVSVDIPEVLIQWLNVTEKVPVIAEQVLVVGSPLGLDQSVSEGIVSAIREIPTLGKFFQTTAPISPGSSGSPVLNMDGNVIGIVSFQSIMGQNINFAISGKKVLDLQHLQHEAPGKTIAEWTYDISNQKQRLAEELCRKGFQFSINGQYQKALTFYKDATEKAPNDLSAWYGLSQCYVGLDNPQAAIETYKDAIRFNLDDGALHFTLGNYYSKLDRLEEAINAYKAAVRIDPDAAAVYAKLGIAYGKLGRHREAIAAHKKVIRINPHAASSYFHMGVAHGKLGEFEEAINAYKQAVLLDPEFAQAYSYLGALYGELDRHEDELTAFKQAIRINPDDAQAHYNIGVAYVNMDDRRAALQEYKILKIFDPEKAARLFSRIYQ